MSKTQTQSFWKKRVLNFFDAVLDTTWQTGVWADCPLMAIRNNPQIAVEYFSHFGTEFTAITDADPPTLNGWTCTQATTGVLSLITGLGGLLELDSESTTQHQGLTMQQTIAPFKLAADKDLWFEVKFRVVDTFDKIELFAGLAKIDGTLLKSDGDLDTDADYVGFGIETTGAGAVRFYECKDTAELSDEVVTIEGNTFIRMGFKITGTTGIQAFVNGVPVDLTNVIASGIPTTDPLAISFVCQTDATNDPLLQVDWIRCIQLL